MTTKKEAGDKPVGRRKAHFFLTNPFISPKVLLAGVLTMMVVLPGRLSAQTDYSAVGLRVADYLLANQDTAGAIPDGLGWNCANLDSTMEYALLGLAAAYERTHDNRYLTGLEKGIEWLAAREEMTDENWRGSWSFRYHTDATYSPWPYSPNAYILDIRGVSTTSNLFVYLLYLHAAVSGSDSLASRYEANARAALDFVLQHNQATDGFFYSCWFLMAVDHQWYGSSVCYTGDQADAYLGMNAGWLLYGDTRYLNAAENLRVNVPAILFSPVTGKYAWARFEDGTLETSESGFSSIFAQAYVPWVLGPGNENQAAYQWMKSCVQPDGSVVCVEGDPAYTLSAVLTVLAASSLGDADVEGILSWIVNVPYDTVDGGVRDTGDPASAKFSNVAGFTAASLLGSLPFRTSNNISGKVTLFGGAASLNSVLLVLSGDGLAITSPDSNGNYTFTNLPQGNYTVSASLENYVFSPSSYTYASLTTDQVDQDFTGTYNGPSQLTLAINSSQGNSNPSVGNYGYASDTAITASVSSPVTMGSTRYVCTGWVGTGSVPATGTGTSVTFTITQDSSITWNWQTQYLLTVNSMYGIPTGAGWYNDGATAYWSVSGVISGGTGTRYIANPSSGSVVMSGPQTVTIPWTTQYLLTTASSPSQGGTVSVTPAGPWYDSGTQVSVTMTAISPWVFKEWSGDVAGSANPVIVTMTGPKSVTGILSTGGSISGKITLSGGSGSVTSVELTLSGSASATAYPGSQGNYTFNNLPYGDYTITPFLSGYTFTPASRFCSSLSGISTGYDFVGIPVAGFCISGYIRTAAGVGIEGVRVTLTNGGSIVTGTNGVYALPVAAGWTGKVTPLKKGYSFTPAYRRYYTPLTSNQLNQNYIGVTRR